MVVVVLQGSKGCQWPCLLPGGGSWFAAGVSYEANTHGNTNESQERETDWWHSHPWFMLFKGNDTSLPFLLVPSWPTLVQTEFLLLATKSPG